MWGNEVERATRLNMYGAVCGITNQNMKLRETFIFEEESKRFKVAKKTGVIKGTKKVSYVYTDEKEKCWSRPKGVNTEWKKNEHVLVADFKWQ